MITLLGTLGRMALNALFAALQVCVLMVDTVKWILVAPVTGRGLRLRASVERFVEYGVRSLPIVGLICFLVGAIMALQAATQLSRYGALSLVASLVGVAALREFAPLMTAIIITGRSGSSITAAIGTMKVSEEIDALEVMGLHPTKYLVVPPFLGMLLALPCLTVLAMAIMIAGGYLVGTAWLNIDPATYLSQTIKTMHLRDFATGMTKSVFFALVICWVGVYRGFQVQGGAEGVGRMTTSSVVTSIFLIIIVDLVFTTLFFSG
jgi:phospholipid/cholesterol/gamma-HCH transport system permease protein